MRRRAIERRNRWLPVTSQTNFVKLPSQVRWLTFTSQTNVVKLQSQVSLLASCYIADQRRQATASIVLAYGTYQRHQATA